MMRNAFVLVTLGVILCALVCWLGGCGSKEQLGETEAEGSRRHQRVLHVNKEEMMGDIDRAMLLDTPSRATDKRIP
jgi:hypothetical protein